MTCSTRLIQGGRLVVVRSSEISTRTGSEFGSLCLCLLSMCIYVIAVSDVSCSNYSGCGTKSGYNRLNFPLRPTRCVSEDLIDER